jgi:hypothetical protein
MNSRQNSTCQKTWIKCLCRFGPSSFNLTFLSAFCNAKMTSNGDKLSFFFTPIQTGNASAACYVIFCTVICWEVHEIPAIEQPSSVYRPNQIAGTSWYGRWHRCSPCRCVGSRTSNCQPVPPWAPSPGHVHSDSKRWLLQKMMLVTRQRP